VIPGIPARHPAGFFHAKWEVTSRPLPVAPADLSTYIRDSSLSACQEGRIMTTPAYPLVSVVVPFFNCPYADRNLNSILRQDYPNIEIIVVDDGSSLHLDRLTPYKDHIRYIRKENGGTASALNTGIQAARGEYIAWLSSDDMMAENKISRQTAFMLEHKALFSYTDYHLIDQNNDVTGQNLAIKFSLAREFVESFLHLCPINGSTVMMHHSLPKLIGLFNETLICAHDYEYWIRALLARVDLYYLNEALTYYRWHSGMGTIRKRELAAQEFHQVRDQYAPHIRTLLTLL
jgi:glycosyltransferase involved in cell wall biosynthesis